MNNVKKISTIIHRNKGWIKSVYHKKQLVHLSFNNFKAIKSPTLVNASVDETLAATQGQVIKIKKTKPLQVINSYKTDLALFGPIIKTKRVKKEKTTKSIENQLLAPLALASQLREDVSISESGKERKKKSSKNKSSQVLVSSAESLNISAPAAIHKDLDLTKVNEEKSLQQKNEQTTEVVQPAANPFFQKNDGVILPFPMLLNKQSEPTATSKEIFTISSTERKMPSVTQILNMTMNETSIMMLALWRKRKIAEVGEEGFQEFMKGLHCSPLFLYLTCSIPKVAYLILFTFPFF